MTSSLQPLVATIQEGPAHGLLPADRRGGRLRRREVAVAPVLHTKRIAKYSKCKIYI